MYTKRELKVAADIIKQIARKHQMTEKQVRMDLEEAMNISRNHPDPAVQALWATFPYTGANPTVEEFILWVANMTKLKQNF